MKKYLILTLLVITSVLSAKAVEPQEIDFQKLESIVATTNRPVIVDVFATWCGPCRQLTPIYNKVASDIVRADFYRMDIDKNPILSSDLGVTSVPTIFLFYIQKGQLKCERQIGYVSYDELSELVRSVIDLSDGTTLKQ